MLLRWIYRIWRVVWFSILTLSIILVLAAGGIFLSLQTGALKTFMAHRLENAFNANYVGQIKIGEITGLLPFDIQVKNVTLTYPRYGSSAHIDTVFQCDTLSFSIDVWELMSRRVKITGFNMRKPEIDLNSLGDSTYTLFRAIQRRGPETKKKQWLVFKDLNIYAPVLSISNAKVRIDSLHNVPAGFTLPHPVVMDSLNLQLFLELSKYQRFLDIGRFDARLPNVIAGRVEAKGQIFNDDRFLEFNRFRVNTRHSRIEVTGEIDGVNLYAGHLWTQLNRARYKMAVDSTKIYLNEFDHIYSHLPKLNSPIEIDASAQGNIAHLDINKLKLAFNNSNLDLHGELQDLRDPDDLSYNLNLEKVHLTTGDLNQFKKDTAWSRYSDIDSAIVKGNIKGNLDSLAVQSKVNFPQGLLAITGKTTLRKPYVYNFDINSQNLKLNQFSILGKPDGVMNMNTSFHGVGIHLNNASINFKTSANNSRINNVLIKRLSISGSLVDGFLQPTFSLFTDSSDVKGKGWINIAGKETQVNIKGTGSDIDLRRFLGKGSVARTDLDFKYDVNVKGSSVDSVYGRANFDVGKAIIAGDTLRPQQLYVDLDSPTKQNRTLRFTSSFADLILKGHMQPTDVFQVGRYWAQYFNKHINKEIRLVGSDSTGVPDPPIKLSRNESVDVSANLHLKNVNLLKYYIPGFPEIATNGHLNASVKADSARLLVSGDWHDNQTKVDTMSVNGSQIMLTASFNHYRNFKQFANFDLKAQIDSLTFPTYSADGVNLSISMKNDSVLVKNDINRIGKNASLHMLASTVLKDTALVFKIQKFNLGNQSYQWTNEGLPGMTYDNHNRLMFNHFIFENDNQRFEMSGAFSSNRRDSVIYSLKNINLQRVSDLINGPFNFEGVLDAKFSTKSLLNVPSIQGNIYVDRLSIDNRPLGDFNFKSKYSPAQKRFNTHISIKADTSKYHDYYVHNDSVATNIQINGYMRPPDPSAPGDTLYYFNVDCKQIDMWVLNYITPNIFSKIEGKADGKGFITGNLDNYNFHADFNTYNVHAVPVFLNSNLYLTGPVQLDRKKGLVIDSVRIHDDQGGTGLFYGTVDLNNFSPVKKLDLTMVMNRLKFLNNKFSPDVPFYGNVMGSGTVRLTGTNASPFIQTITPITTTSNSKLDIPLLDETSVQNQSKFIEFVKNFNSKGKNNQSSPAENSLNNSSNTASEQLQEDKTFTELFQLDLRFIAPQNSTIEFIFDPVTGEILTAKGGGQVNITLEDQDVQMFGRFDISGGDYLFVGGDVFSRRFYLQNGGTISWEGDPRNPRIDITSVYRARPNLQPITNENRHVPINLILKLTGNIKSVKNDFYFEFPNSLDLSQNSTVLSFLNSEDQKLIQATSLLLTGSFSSVSTPNGTENQAVATNIQNRAAQVGLSQLLSNQINTLLNSSLSDLDIDLNMNGFNQADLGIALRLFNDKLVLRREGTIGGGPQYDNLGDLGAQYQINPSLSVEVFHRQDPSLSSSYVYGASSQLPSVNGVGLRYQVQFNSWKELPGKILRSIGSIFSGKKKKNKKMKASKTLAPEDSTRSKKITGHLPQ